MDIFTFQLKIWQPAPLVYWGWEDCRYKSLTVVLINCLISLQIWKDRLSSFWEQFSTRLLDSCYLHQSKCSASPCLYFLVCWQEEIWDRFNPLEAAEVSIFIQCSRSSLKNRLCLMLVSLKCSASKTWNSKFQQEKSRDFTCIAFVAMWFKVRADTFHSKFLFCTWWWTNLIFIWSLFVLTRFSKWNICMGCVVN